MLPIESMKYTPISQWDVFHVTVLIESINVYRQAIEEARLLCESGILDWLSTC